MGHDFGCICSKGQDLAEIPVPNNLNDENTNNNNLPNNNNEPKEEHIPKKDSILKSSTTKYNHNHEVMVLKIQSLFKKFKSRKIFNLMMSERQKIFDTNILNYGEYIKESQINTYLNPEVKQIISKLKTIIPSKNESNSYHFVFNREAFLFRNNTIYKGSWNYNGKKHGYGMFINAEGALYEGFWSNDVCNGRGRYVDQKGYYEGEWVMGESNSKGTLVLTNGYRYEGEWKKDIPNGNGKESYEDGGGYEGQIKGGVKEGKGVFKWSDGSKYDGMFVNSKMKGKGIFTWKDGRIYNGQWDNNAMNGKGVFTWPNGSKYEGDYFNNKKEGSGTYYWTKDIYYVGNWLNNQQHGEGILYQNNHQIKGIFRYGKIIQSDEEKASKESSQIKKIKDSYNDGGMIIIPEVSE